MIRGCAQERATWEASASGRWTPAQTDHAIQCAACAEVRRVTEALRSPVTPMPASTDPAVLWWCARYMRRLRMASRVERVTTLSHIAVLAALLTLAGSFIDWPSVRSLFDASITIDASTLAVAMTAMMAVAGAVVWLLRETDK